MRATITLPDDVAREVREVAGSESFSAFAREAIERRLEQIRREELRARMLEGYRAEADEPSMDPEWSSADLDGWE